MQTINVDEKKLISSLEEARHVLDVEAESILNLKETIGQEFLQVMDRIVTSQGRVVFIGVGKSGIIGKKISATFSSTGTPSFFVHGGEALHGDLGMVTEKDVVISISNSGESEEIIRLLPAIKRIGAVLIAMTGNRESTLACFADLILYSGVEEEACPHGLAPTASTTATLALGDALAVTLSSLKGFTPEDFALYHPGGSLGRRLLTRVRDVLEIRKQNPVVTLNTTIKEALFIMTDTKMGSTAVVDEDGNFIGIITDGDIRRLLEKSVDFLNKPASGVMTSNPTSIGPNRLATEALKIMEEREISDLPVIDNDKPIGMVNFQDLLRAKIL